MKKGGLLHHPIKLSRFYFSAKILAGTFVIFYGVAIAFAILAMRGERRDRTFTIPLHKLLGALNIVMISPLKHECIFIVPIGVNRANTVRLSYRCVPRSRSAGINAIRIFHILWNVGTRTRITSHNVGRFPNTFRLTAYPSALVTFIPQSE